MYGNGPQSRHRPHTRGWRNRYGELSLRLKLGTHGPTQTFMVMPTDTVKSLINQSIYRTIANPLPEGLTASVFYRREDLADYYDDTTVEDLEMESADTLYVKVYDEDGDQMMLDGEEWVEYLTPSQRRAASDQRGLQRR